MPFTSRSSMPELATRLRIPCLRRGANWHRGINSHIISRIGMSGHRPLILVSGGIMGPTFTVSHGTCVPLMVGLIV